MTRQLQADVEASAAAAAAAREEFRLWKEEVGPVTEEEFREHAEQAVRPGYDYFRGLYMSETGSLRSTFIAFRGASLLNPLKLRRISVEAARMLVDDLSHFGFREFTPGFLENVKSEVFTLWQQARENFDWGGLDGAADYDRKLRSKLAKTQADQTATAERVAALDAGGVVGGAGVIGGMEMREEQHATWEEDPAECSRRIWLWWRIRVHEVRKFQYLPRVLCLVALVQPPSAAIERVFSQLKLIVGQCGEPMLEATLLSRLLERCNINDFPLM